MKSEFSKTWIKSTQPRKQRKYVAKAPLHIKGKLMSAHLSKDLREKYNKRSFRLRSGDTVKVMKGSFKGKTGLIESVDISKQKVMIETVEYTKKDGSKSKYPIHVSNVLITEFKLDDKKRKLKLESSIASKTSEVKKVQSPKSEEKNTKSE